MTSITRYEVVARRNGRAVLIGYTPRRSRPGLIAAMRKHGPQLIEFLRPGEHDAILLGGYPPDFVIGEWRVGFSGRTQARAQHDGELSFFLDAPRTDLKPTDGSDSRLTR
jgi:hypothetical protein